MSNYVTTPVLVICEVEVRQQHQSLQRLSAAPASIGSTAVAACSSGRHTTQQRGAHATAEHWLQYSSAAAVKAVMGQAMYSY
jgi:hypothetical protein